MPGEGDQPEEVHWTNKAPKLPKVQSIKNSYISCQFQIEKSLTSIQP